MQQPDAVRILAYFEVDRHGRAWMVGVLDHLAEIGGTGGLDGAVIPATTGGRGLPPDSLPGLPADLPLIAAPDSPDAFQVPTPLAAIYLNAGLSSQMSLVQPHLPPDVPLYLVANLLSQAGLQPLDRLAALIVEDSVLGHASENRLHLLYALRRAGLPLGYRANLGEVSHTRHAIGYGASTIVIALRQPADPSRLERGQRLEMARALREHVGALRAFGESADDPVWGASPEELDHYHAQRLSLVAARRLHRGETVTPDMVRAALLDGGIGADLLPRILGMSLAYDIPAGKPITFGMLSGKVPR
jgi:hypothetical protein